MLQKREFSHFNTYIFIHKEKPVSYLFTTFASGNYTNYHPNTKT